MLPLCAQPEQLYVLGTIPARESLSQEARWERGLAERP